MRLTVRKYWAIGEKQDAQGNDARVKSALRDPSFIELEFDENSTGSWVYSEEESTPERLVFYYKDVLKAGHSSEPAVTGIRVSELIDLKLSQVKDEYILIHGKGDKERVVPKSPLLNKWMFKYLNTRENFFAYRRVPENVFLSRNGRPMTTEAIHRVIKIAGKAVGVSRDIRVSPHTCRQMQLKNGLDLYSLSRLMGHSNISITQRYLEGLRDFEVLNACKATGILMNL